MARMTKMQREAAEEAVRVEQEKQLRVEYPTRLMKALSQATELKFVLSVFDDSFVVTEPNETYPEMFTMSYEYNAEAEQQLYDLELELKLKYVEFAEKERRQRVRANALAKLSFEECELLGVK
jgi:hypothetical protein